MRQRSSIAALFYVVGNLCLTSTSAQGKLTFDDGITYELGPENITDSTVSLHVDNSTFLVISSDVSVSTILVTDQSVINIVHENITVIGLDYTQNNWAVGGDAIALSGESHGSFVGKTINIVGGEGNSDYQAGKGGDALQIAGNSSAVIDGANLIAGSGYTAGKALYVKDGAQVEIRDGYVSGAVLIEGGSEVDVYGGLFMDPIDVKGSDSTITFHGCFSLSENVDSGSIEVTGTFANSDTETKPITVNTSQGGDMMIEEIECDKSDNYEAANEDIADGLNETDATIVPTSSPTYEETYAPSGSMSIRENQSTLLMFSLGLVFGYL